MKSLDTTIKMYTYAVSNYQNWQGHYIFIKYIYVIKPREKSNQENNLICYFYFLQTKLVIQAKFGQCLLRTADILDTSSWQEHRQEQRQICPHGNMAIGASFSIRILHILRFLSCSPWSKILNKCIDWWFIHKKYKL